MRESASFVDISKIDAFDSSIVIIDLNANVLQAAQGSLIVDADGQRQATVLFPAGTQATMTLPDGSTQPLMYIKPNIMELLVLGVPLPYQATEAPAQQRSVLIVPPVK